MTTHALRRTEALPRSSQTYFVSGCNHAGEIRGVALAGLNVGIAVNELDAAGNAERELIGLAGTSTRIFVDSGAFGEVRFDPSAGRLVIDEEISDAEWESRLDTYERLATALTEQVYVVAPDCVGHQAETLARLTKYASRVRGLAQLGAHVIVPVQKGELPMARFWVEAVRILELPAERLVAGIPSKKDATTTLDVAAFVRDAVPARVHFLGLGPKSRRYDDVMQAVRVGAKGRQMPEVLMDSVRITALVGRSGGYVRPLTAARDALIAEGFSLADTAALKCASILRVFEQGRFI